MAGKLIRWLDERWPLTPLVKLSLEEDIPGRASFAYVFGSSALILFAVQAATGVLQLLYYVPTVDHAYASLSYLRLGVPFGWLIHGLHYWGANAMLVVVWLHMARVFIWGAYKHPRELNWLLGVLLLLLTLGMSFTGAPLPWDQRGYWATEVGTSIAGMTPLIGGILKRLAQGAETMGQLALSRFFILHVAILPGLLGAFILAHLIAFRKNGSVGPWSEEKRARKGPFWPDQVAFDAISGVAFFLIIVALASFAAPAFAGPADPVDRSFEPKPEWNFLFLYQAIKAFRGALEPVGTVGLPLVATLLLLLVPFIDRRKERDPFRRPLAMGVLLASIAGLVALTIAGAMSKPGVQASGTSPGAVSAGGASGGPSVSGPGAGKFKSLGCAGCHRIGDSGGAIGPDLTAEGRKGRSRDWLGTQIRNPGEHNPKTLMPAFPKLTDAELNGLIDFLEGLGMGTSKPAPAQPAVPSPSLRESTATASAPAEPAPRAETAAPSGSSGDTAADMIGNPEIGARFFASICQSCHGPEGKGGIPNPGSEDGTVPPLNPIDRELFSPDPGTFAASLDRLLQHGSTPPGPGPALKMPAFGDASTLTQPEIANLEAYVLRLNGVSRDAVLHPGMKPALFFGLVLAAFGALGLGLLGARFKSRTKS